MRKKTTKSLAVIALIATAIFAFRILTQEHSTTHSLSNLLMSAGFKNISMPEPDKKAGAWTYEKIALDADGFSNIGKVSIQTGWLGDWTNIEFENIELTGELENNFQIVLAGWDPHKINFLTLILPSNPVISIKNARLSLLNKDIGGIDIKLDMQIRPKEDHYEFQARLEGAQSQLSYSANAEGTLTKEGFWQTSINLEQAKFALGLIKATRINGTIDLSGQALENSQILGELQAGALNVVGLPWENASLTLEGSLPQTQMIISANSAGREGLELSMTLNTIQNLETYSGSFHAETLSSLFDYLQAKKSLFLDRAALAPLADFGSIEGQFKGDRHFMAFELADARQSVILRGEIKPVDLDISLQKLAEGLPFELKLENTKERYKTTLALSQDRKNLVRLPEGKNVEARLQKRSELMDIFRP